MAMSLLILLAAAPLAVPDLTSMDVAVATCDRDTVSAIYGAEPARRSAFMTELFNEQQAIFTARREIAAKRQALRAASLDKSLDKPVETETQLAFQNADLDERQNALNDARSLDNLRRDALDAKRRLYLAQCGGNGKHEKGQ